MRFDNGFAAPAGKPCADDYDQMPYPSMPFAYTQPAHLAALAALFGIEAPPANAARVLELGCASGGNIIPLAARFPKASFLGIDLARRHVDDGQRRISALGLTNVEIRQGDLASLRSLGEPFDYIICHGVFSWVSEAVQHAIFQICGENLRNSGIATISYNVLPGWHRRSIVRDICLYHAEKELTPRQRVDKARSLLDEIAKSASETQPYGLLIRDEAKRIAKLPSAYIYGEFLATENAPSYFQDFVGRAEQYGLSYLCESDLASSVSQSLFPETEQRLKLLAGSSRLAMEQYIDFFTGRPFRRSILIKARSPLAETRMPTPDLLRPFHIASEIRFDPDRSTAQFSVYTDVRDRAITTEDAAVRYALAQLAKHYPCTLPLEQLTSSAQRNSIPEAEARVCKALFRLIAAGQATVSSVPLRVGSVRVERPRAWPLARTEAAAGQPWVTSMRHEPIPLDTALAFLLVLLDGNHDRRALNAKLLEASRCGQLRGAELQLKPEKINRISLESAIEQYIERKLELCEWHALLEPVSACTRASRLVNQERLK